MTTPARVIPRNVSRVQIEAANPDVSAFVSANAGSGKTHVLSQRVINLLLRGVDPAKILCITFTKAAAATMANRVFETLAKWPALDDIALKEAIEKSSGQKADAKVRARARRLFASALETPGGLKVQTIHAFCTRLLHQFPFEANVAARFEVLDDARTTQLLESLTLSVLQEAAVTPEGALGQALKGAIVAAADQTFKDVITDAIGKRDAIMQWIAQSGGIDQAMETLAHDLGIDPADSMEAIEADYFAKSLIKESEWPALIDALAAGSKSDANHIAALIAVRGAMGRARIEEYLKIFCTAEFAPRKRIVTDKVAKASPHWQDRLSAEQDRVCKLLERERAVAARDRTRALVTIAGEVIARYRAEKDRRGLLDYDDLIDKILALFARSSAAWVLYKLDLGIDHVLVDEAQDTSPKQWAIIKTIVSEFISGSARENVKRTIFAVGDEKQSIFSFQGAAPHAFVDVRHHFEKMHKEIARDFIGRRFEFSFRSGPNVLGAVDTVFARAEAFSGLSADPVATVHQALPDAAPGLVEIWPLIAAEKRDDIEGWDAPFDKLSEESPQVKLARRIAGNVKIWMEQGTHPKDVLILVRQRGPLFEAVIRALKNRRIPVAGADRLKLIEHIAVLDLMALADSLLLPDDDLALASVLKSPLFGLDDDDLFKLAWNRKGSLRAALRAKTGDNPAYGMADAALDRFAKDARRFSPFAFFARVLGGWRGRANMLKRLGPEANDALDEFLNLALEYERHATPSLQGFMAWLGAAQSEVKRDMEMARDEVRVMTVHGAKGLEANTVVLADTTTLPTGPRDPRLLALPNGVVWATAKTNDIGAMAQAREATRSAARDEYRRLLYVGMTRAAERLIVCGAQGTRKIPEGCWYDLVSTALEPVSVSEPADDGDGEVKRFRKFPDTAASSGRAADSAPAKIELPEWLHKRAAAETRALRLIAPSAAGEDDSLRVAAGGRETALLRGRLLHRLMQSLPDIPAERRKKAADDFIGRATARMSAEERRPMAMLAEQALRLFASERCSALFGPGSRAEVPIVGNLPQGRVSGQIDRLAVTQEAVWIADFKTGQIPPTAPDSYVKQLALYRTVLAKLYPDRPIRAAVIWTEVPEFMELSPDILDGAIAQITTA